MSLTIELQQLQISPRRAIGPGSLVRLTGGGQLGERGLVKVRRIIQETRRGHTRAWVDGLTEDGRYVVALVQGKPYKRSGVTWKPHKIRVA